MCAAARHIILRTSAPPCCAECNCWRWHRADSSLIDTEEALYLLSSNTGAVMYPGRR